MAYNTLDIADLLILLSIKYDILEDFDTIIKEDQNITPECKMALFIMLEKYKKYPKRKEKVALLDLAIALFSRTWEDLGYSQNLPDLSASREYLAMILKDYIQDKLAEMYEFMGATINEVETDPNYFFTPDPVEPPETPADPEV